MPAFAIEHELHQVITEDYPVAKYQVEAEMLEELSKEMKSHSKKGPNVMGNNI